jgi:hypothetical protein
MLRGRLEDKAGIHIVKITRKKLFFQVTQLVKSETYSFLVHMLENKFERINQAEDQKLPLPHTPRSS